MRCSTLAVSGRRVDAGEVRDDLRGYVVDNLGDPNAVLVVDETGDLKKGTATVGVQRQYTGTAGRIENAQVAVYLTYAAPAGHAFIDRARRTCPPVGPATRSVARARRSRPKSRSRTRPALAGQMIARRPAGGQPAQWVAGDEVTAPTPSAAHPPRAAIGIRDANRREPAHVPIHAGPTRVEVLASIDPPRAWCRSAPPAPAARPTLVPPAGSTAPLKTPDETGHHWLLIRRNDTTGELAYHRCYSPHPRDPSPRWSRSPGNAGASRNPSKPPRPSLRARPAPSPDSGSPSTAGPSWPCSRTPSSP